MSGSHGEKTREYITVTEGVLTIECHGHTQTINKDQSINLRQISTYLIGIGSGKW